MLSVATSDTKRSIWRTRIVGSALRSTCWVASFELDWTTFVDRGCETRASASSIVCTESGCVKGLEVSLWGRNGKKRGETDLNVELK